MRTLAVLLASLFVLAAHAETTVERFTADDEWPAFMNPDGSLAPNIINPGEFFCTGGGETVEPFVCEGGNGIVINGTQMVSCATNSDPHDGRVEGLVWFDITAIWDAKYTGPVAGHWRIIPGACGDLSALETATTYWEGTYKGRRKLVMGPELPTWISKLRMVGHGVGDLEGQTVKAREIIKTYYIVPAPWELLPEDFQMLLGGTGPEGKAFIRIKSED